MMDNQKITKLKKIYHESEKKIGKIGKKQFSNIVKLSEELGELIKNIELAQEKGKNKKNAGVGIKIKMMRKGIRLSKELNNFEKEIVKRFAEKDISEEIGKKFVEILKLIKNNQLDLAKYEFEYFEKIIELNKQYIRAKEELEMQEATLKRERNRIKKLLIELKELEEESIDLEKVQKYEKFLDDLNKLEKLRKGYITSLISEPMKELFERLSRYSQKKYSFPLPKMENLAEVKEFFSENKELSMRNASQICETFDYSEKKLSHICPETSKFKKIVLNNREWFEGIRNLDQTSFLSIEGFDEKILDFYSEEIEGSREIINRILEFKKQEESCKEEYRKDIRIKEKKKELSKYSKEGLEKELREIEELIELIHSKPEEEEKIEEEKKEEKQGLFSTIKSFFKIK